MKMEIKYAILKAEDIAKLDIDEQIQFGILCKRIENIRASEGKSINNSYLVINTDEPYADDVIQIMQQHGHWGESGILEGVCDDCEKYENLHEFEHNRICFKCLEIRKDRPFD
ncbi:hypothetical protein [Paenibacillus ehimensis]|uniref:hypothetical protein n=1 Tax=Paenibacillus ehimensis TaxID=79264 RepID=UPI0006875FFB|nr:hypothetical protein [Paenibacillus ehimensis]